MPAPVPMPRAPVARSRFTLAPPPMLRALSKRLLGSKRRSLSCSALPG
jgi:hypothetical protein